MAFNEDDFLEEKSDRLESVPGKFVESIQGLETKIVREIEQMVSTLETVEGQIILSDKNILIIDTINKRIKDVIFDAQYEKDLTKFIGEYQTQAELNNSYFRAMDVDFEPTSMYQNVLRNSQRNAISLLSEDAYTQVLITPLQASLQAAVTGQQSFTDTLSQLRYIIQGDEEVDGKLISHVKRVAYDSFAVSDRSYTGTIATDLELEFYRYTGGKVKETRCFCEERKGKYFHRKEIAGWGEGKNVGSCSYPWQGMNSNTDSVTIFYYAGGYNCKHSILPVSIKSVPIDVINRAKAKGWYSGN